MKTPPITILVDTREQQVLPITDYPTERVTLATGDYSIRVGDVDYSDRCVVERKSHGDAWSSIGMDRPRFERCIRRLALIERPAIVLECTLGALCERPSRIQRVTPATIVGSLISWSAQYRIPVFFADDRAYAARIVSRFLTSYVKHERTIAAHAQTFQAKTTEALSSPLVPGSPRPVEPSDAIRLLGAEDSSVPSL